MARSRNIKPAFFRNELLVELLFEYRLLFIGLWTISDRAGRFEDRPTRIKMELFPADVVDINAGLQALHEGGFISRYTVGQQRFCQVLAWDKHQNPHLKEALSTIPAPDLHGTSTISASDLHGASTVPAEETPEQARLIPDSLNLIPDSKAFEQQAARPTVKRADRFEEFWAAYPVKKGRADALKTWMAKNLDSIADTIIADVKQRKVQDREWLEGFAPHGSTYVNGKGWEDDIPAVRDCPGSGTQTPDHMLVPI